ncbi:MAG: STAS domain-containing protein [Solirubrobacteraceae bacterium]
MRDVDVCRFEIRERQDGAWRRLCLEGELDLGSASVLQERLDMLRAETQWVRLDLSSLDFMDSSGIRLLVQAITDADQYGWSFEIAPELSPQVNDVLEMTSLKRFVAGRRDAGGRVADPSIG